ncbi:hypothetical protein LTS18_004841 [Coniosporium uncinatum]|uniref:Uncharacterized protein n=1 Tax=Coniosporium uncinatum TaxID=93489 RepID=A0ACC3D5C0_9PEZI|nr:hypothetical protein LTS18_004841 [Coniosporium uncinatum]
MDTEAADASISPQYQCFRFVDLPRKVRNLVYHAVLSDLSYTHESAPCWGSGRTLDPEDARYLLTFSSAVAGVSHQLRHEFLTILHNSYTFQVKDVTSTRFLKLFSIVEPQYMIAMKRLIINVNVNCKSGYGIDMDIRLSADRRSFILKGQPRLDEPSEDRLNSLAEEMSAGSPSGLRDGTQLVSYAAGILRLSEESRIHLSDAGPRYHFSLMLPNKHQLVSNRLPFRFLDLPAETRHSVYDHYFELGGTNPELLTGGKCIWKTLNHIDHSDAAFFRDPLFRLSRYVRQEAQPMFLANNLFVFTFDNPYIPMARHYIPKFFKTLGWLRLKHITRVVVDFIAHEHDRRQHTASIVLWLSKDRSKMHIKKNCEFDLLTEKFIAIMAGLLSATRKNLKVTGRELVAMAGSLHQHYVQGGFLPPGSSDDVDSSSSSSSSSDDDDYQCPWHDVEIPITTHADYVAFHKEMFPRHFTTLPNRLRDRIYKLVLSSDTPTDSPLQRSQSALPLSVMSQLTPQPAITATNRQVRAESLEIYYASNVFRLSQQQIIATRGRPLFQPSDKRFTYLTRLVTDLRAFERRGDYRVSCVARPKVLLELSGDRHSVRVGFSRRLDPISRSVMCKKIKGVARGSTAQLSGNGLLDVVRKVVELSWDLELVVEAELNEAWWWWDIGTRRERAA